MGEISFVPERRGVNILMILSSVYWVMQAE